MCNWKILLNFHFMYTKNRNYNFFITWILKFLKISYSSNIRTVRSQNPACNIYKYRTYNRNLRVGLFFSFWCCKQGRCAFLHALHSFEFNTYTAKLNILEVRRLNRLVNRAVSKTDIIWHFLQFKDIVNSEIKIQLSSAQQCSPKHH